MQISIDIDVKSIIALIADITINFVRSKMDKKFNENDTQNEISLDFNRNLLPNLAIDFDGDQKMIESNQKSITQPLNDNPNHSITQTTKQLKNVSPGFVQSSQLRDSNNNFVCSPRRTKYVTRASQQESHNTNNSFSLDHQTTLNDQSNNNTDSKTQHDNVTTTSNYYTIVSPGRILFNGKYVNANKYSHKQDTPILNSSQIQKHPKSPLPTKRPDKRSNNSPNSIISILSHLDYNHLLSINVSKYTKWKISFNKLKKNTVITKPEIITLRNELCKSNPIIFLSGSTRKTPYEQWMKLNEFYINAPQNSTDSIISHRPSSILIPKFCVKFTPTTWAEFLANNFRLGYNPENWIWNENQIMDIPSPTELQKQNTFNLSPIQMNLLPNSPELHFQPCFDDEKTIQPSPQMISNFNNILNDSKQNDDIKQNTHINPSTNIQSSIIPKNSHIPRTEFFDPNDQFQNNRTLLMFNKIISEQFNHYTKQNSPVPLRLPIIVEIFKFIVYYNIDLTQHIKNQIQLFFPEVFSTDYFNNKLTLIFNHASEALKNAKFISSKNARIRPLTLAFPFSNKRYEFFKSDTDFFFPKRKKRKIDNSINITQYNPTSNKDPSTRNTTRLSRPKSQIPIDKFLHNNSHNILQHISDQLAELTKKQKELDSRIKNEQNQNISTLDDMLYSDKRGLKAFGVDKQGKQIMKIVSTAIDNDRIEYKYKLLTDILNSNSNKQIAQKLQGMSKY